MDGSGSIVAARDLGIGRNRLIWRLIGCITNISGVNPDIQRLAQRLLLPPVPEDRIRLQNDIEAVLLCRAFEGIGYGAGLRAIAAVIIAAVQLINAFRRYALSHTASLRYRVLHHGKAVGHGDLHFLILQVQRALHHNVQRYLP